MTHIKPFDFTRPPRAVWMFGLSGSGKSTIANQVHTDLCDLGRTIKILDGDTLRSGLNSDLGFTDEDRTENLRRAAWVARLFLDTGFDVLCCFITPLKAQRALVKDILGESFVECFIDAPIEVCIQRDPKGLYEKQKKGELSLMAGVDSVFEKPDKPDLHIRSHERDLKEISLHLQKILAV